MSAPETVTANFLVLQTIAFGAIPTQSIGASLTLNATASSGLPVSYSSLTTNVCTVSGSTASMIAAGPCSIQASQAGNGVYAPATPVTQTFNVIASAAAYRGYDIATQGNWTGQYGADGYLIANDVSSPPSYATVSLSGDNAYTWANPTSDPRALQTASGSSTLIASTYYSPTSFSVKVNLIDGNAHRIALYLLDWDSSARAETISILDAATSAVLNTQTFSGFHNGQYVSWSVQGNVVIQVTRTRGVNAVVAGIFFDPVPSSAASATYSGLDTATQGAWGGFYGSDGQLIANDDTNPGAYATVSLSGDSTYTWATPTTDPRALETTSGSSTLIASAYYAPTSFNINVNLTDGNAHRLTLYLVDWDSTARAETISIVDATTSKVLDTETFASFHGGQYASWNVQGHVLIRVTRTGGANAVVSGIFFDPPPSSASASYVGLDKTTGGTWTGSYGSNGELIATEAPNLAALAAVDLTGDKLYTWASPTTDARALQTASGSSTLIASTYYSSSSFSIDVNLKDGNTHKISLYLLDWDSTSRAETVAILNADDNTILDTESYSSFHNGEYAAWNVTGHVVIQVTKTGGTNAVVSGIFVD
jgi:hypothetical protein